MPIRVVAIPGRAGQRSSPGIGIPSPDIHGALRGSERDLSGDEIWNNPDAQMYNQMDEQGQIIKLVDNGDSTYRSFVICLTRPAGTPFLSGH
jgi:hypothetical protein